MIQINEKKAYQPEVADMLQKNNKKEVPFASIPVITYTFAAQHRITSKSKCDCGSS